MTRGILVCCVLLLSFASCRQPAPRGEDRPFGPDVVEVEPAPLPEPPLGPDPSEFDAWVAEFSAWSERFDAWAVDYAEHEAARDAWNARFASWARRFDGWAVDEERSAAERDALGEEFQSFKRQFERWMSAFQEFESRQRARSSGANLRRVQ